MLACDGFIPAPVSVIDVATQTETDTLSLGPGLDCNSVQVCDDGSTVLATNTTGTGRVHRLTLDGAGMLTNTGSSFTIASPQNVSCAPGSASAVVTRTSRQIDSFLIPGMAGVDNRLLSGGILGIASVINPAGDKVFSRTGLSPVDTGTVDRFGYNSTTGILSAAPEATILVAPSRLLKNPGDRAVF